MHFCLRVQHCCSNSRYRIYIPASRVEERKRVMLLSFKNIYPSSFFHFLLLISLQPVASWSIPLFSTTFYSLPLSLENGNRSVRDTVKSNLGSFHTSKSKTFSHLQKI